VSLAAGISLSGCSTGTVRSVIAISGGLSEKTTKTDRSRPVALDAVGIALLVDYQACVDHRPGNQRPVILDDGFVFSP